VVPGVDCGICRELHLHSEIGLANVDSMPYLGCI